jgi:hypothetical protein
MDFLYAGIVSSDLHGGLLYTGMHTFWDADGVRPFKLLSIILQLIIADCQSVEIKMFSTTTLARPKWQNRSDAKVCTYYQHISFFCRTDRETPANLIAADFVDADSNDCYLVYMIELYIQWCARSFNTPAKMRHQLGTTSLISDYGVTGIDNKASITRLVAKSICWLSGQQNDLVPGHRDVACN